MYTVIEFARLIGVPYATFVAALNQGRIPEPKMLLGKRRIFTDADKKNYESYFTKPRRKAVK